jgi:hypothetical protein
MIRIRAIPFCQVSKQGIRREENAIARIGKGGLCIGDQIEKAADIFALRPPGKKLNAYGLASPGALRAVVEAAEARESNACST